MLPDFTIIYINSMLYHPGLALGVWLSVLAEVNTEAVDAVAVNHTAAIHRHTHVSIHTHTHATHTRQ